MAARAALDRRARPARRSVEGAPLARANLCSPRRGARMKTALRAVPVLLALMSLSLLLVPRRAGTVPVYAARTGLQCQNCHFDPNGGGPRNDFGFMYARQRHSVTPEDSGSTWAALDLTNRIGERMPVYVSVNQRFMALTNSTVEEDSLDRFGFYNMESSIHLAFQPHERLTLVYSRDGFQSGSTTKDVWGMISGLPYNGYFRAGRFRNPFGLRMDDHTVATRNGFLDFQPVFESYLPYDHRTPDEGLEVGVAPGNFYGRMSLTNGGVPYGASAFGSQYAQAFAAKIGLNLPAYQNGFSFYDDFRDDQRASFADRRATRWAYYGTTHWQDFTLLGEIGAGTDYLGGTEHVNLLAGFVEANYALNRWANVRFRFDYLDLDRSSAFTDAGAVSLNRRYALEGEFLPVPFAEIRWTLRYIDPSESVALDGLTEIPDERQAYVQFHFSY
jgi:hypothetical protein